MKLVPFVVLLLTALVYAADTCKNIPSPRVGGRLMRVKWVSAGQAGVWSVSQSDDIFYRRGTYNTVNNKKHGSVYSWARIPGKLKQIGVGWNIVWGVNRNDDIFCRFGISQNNPQGVKWVHVGGKLKIISVCPFTNAVWGVNKNDDIFFRTGITGTTPLGTGWKHIPGKLKQISVDGAGVWGVNSHDRIYFRRGTFMNQNSPGTRWARANGRLGNIDSGDKVIWGVNKYGAEYRAEIESAPRPHGPHVHVSWKKTSTKKREVSINGNRNDRGHQHVWSLNRNGKLCVKNFK